MAKMDMPLHYNWGGGNPTPTKTPTGATHAGGRPRGGTPAANKAAAVSLTNKAKRYSPVTKLLLSEGKLSVQQLRDMGFDVSIIPQNPTSNAALQPAVSRNKSGTAIPTPYVSNEMRNPYSPMSVVYTGNQYSPFDVRNNNISLNQAANVPVSYSGMDKNTGMDAQQNQALTYNGMGDVQLMNYYQSLLNESAMSNNKTYGGYSPTYYGGYGYGGGGYGGGSYSPFDFFFNLLNWRI